METMKRDLQMADESKRTPELERMVREMIDAVADRWTMYVLEALEEHGEVRFTRLAELVGGVSQKMLTKTLRQMERDGLIARTVHPVIPPHVEYRLTDMGLSLSEAFCGVWQWVLAHQERVQTVRREFDARPKMVVAAK